MVSRGHALPFAATMVNARAFLLERHAMDARTRPAVFVLVATALVILGATPARAAQYPGWGDTGWVYASKRDCCNAAIDIAAQYSAEACVTSGGVPRPFAGASQRGTCSSEWTQQEDGSVLFRCYGEASVWCR
jgi:hypothetical protein